MKPDLNRQQLEPYRHDLEVVRQTAEQVIRDFGMTGLKVEFSGNPQTAYSELTEQLIPVLRDLHQSDWSRLRALLYRIDLPENQLETLQKTASGPGFAEALTHLVLEREFMKVLFRKLYHHPNG